MPGEIDWRLTTRDGHLLRGFRRAGTDAVTGVFVHGFRSHCDGGKARRLSDWAGRRGIEWLRFDQRGCGRSAGDRERFTVSGAIDDLHDTLAALDNPPCVLAGSSLGALLAVHAAAAGRNRVRGLLLIAPALRFTRRLIHDHLDPGQLDGWRRRGYRWFADLYAGGCFRLNYTFCADALRYDQPPTRLTCPVLVIHDSRDEVLPLSDTRAWLATLDCPQRGLEIVAGGDHRLTEWADLIARHTENLWNEVR